ncbi:MAG TPA: type II toxin-antitoxin system HicA family toxin [Xanthobacteraceae bacterium]|nr:type II toxin-antitoxin system HicA family toxin [Xanthobacteraceae bacterium]
MSGFWPDLRRILMDNGWELLRSAKGDHVVWWHPETSRKITIDPGTKSRHTANGILKEAGLPKAF